MSTFILYIHKDDPHNYIVLYNFLPPHIPSHIVTVCACAVKASRHIPGIPVPAQLLLNSTSHVYVILYFR